MSRRRKPDTVEAMRRLIAAVRQAVPLEPDAETLCRDGCQACSLKLVEFLASELADWEARLDAGEKPSLADLSRLERTARKVHRALQKNGLT